MTSTCSKKLPLLSFNSFIKNFDFNERILPVFLRFFRPFLSRCFHDDALKFLCTNWFATMCFIFQHLRKNFTLGLHFYTTTGQNLTSLVWRNGYQYRKCFLAEDTAKEEAAYWWIYYSLSKCWPKNNFINFN